MDRTTPTTEEKQTVQPSDEPTSAARETGKVWTRPTVTPVGKLPALVQQSSVA